MEHKKVNMALFKDLMDKYVTESISEEETRQLHRLIDIPEYRAELEQYVDSYFTGQELDSLNNPALKELIKSRLQQVISRKRPARIILLRRIAVAASIILVVALAVTLSLSKRGAKEDMEIVTAPNVVKPPETNRAMITLADGRKVFLDEAGNGQLALQGNVKLVKLSDGQIAYQTESGEIVKEIQYNTLTNPRGSKVIDMTLSDGSHVWLNAGSSLTYPVAFIGNERKVNIKGEAYFEITHDKSRPFRVSLAPSPSERAGGEVEVLGTKFNVNAYDDEDAIRVTLLEGSVKVSNNEEAVVIKPGQQARVSQNSPLGVGVADLEQVMAWKDNRFYFMSADIHTITRQLERWYDVEVEILSEIPDHFTGIISRDVNASEVFSMLQKTGTMNVKIEGKKIVITK